MAKKLIITDLDGTLLDKVEELSEKFGKRLDYLIEKGLDIVICTGRDYENTKKAMKYVSNYNNPYILTNGAVLTDLNGSVMQSLLISEKSVKTIIQLASRNKIKPMVYSYVRKKDNKAIYIKGKWWSITEFQHLQPFNSGFYDKFDQSSVISIQFCDLRENLIEFYESSKKMLSDVHILFFEDAFLKDYYWLEFNPENATKEYMIEKLLKIKGYTRDQLVVFGDQTNDIGMLKMAKKAIVVSNAPNHVKQHATEIIGTNKEGAVIKYLEEHQNDFI